MGTVGSIGTTEGANMEADRGAVNRALCDNTTTKLELMLLQPPPPK
jgi:hypothetical protein